MSDRDALNRRAVDDPQPGDYWHEMFCPYFVVVQVKGEEITVLSCLGGPSSFSRKEEPNAMINNHDGTWSFDYSKHMVVDRSWIKKAVTYDTIDGFCADVVRDSAKFRSVVDEWRDSYQNSIKEKIHRLELEFEEFTGWKYLKDNVS